MKHTLLGVNIDHIATVRQARKISYPDPVQAVILAEEAGADGITLHLREDRRHIQDRDVYLIKEVLQTRMNLEMAATEEMVKIAEKVKPTFCCLVPEKREEVTTEGGLDVIKQKSKIKSICDRLKKTDIDVSLFIAPDKAQIDAALYCKAPIIEIHTGSYAECKNEKDKERELKKIITAAKYAKSKGLIVNAGHGLNYQNVQAIANIPEITELNIGHSIIARALFVGIKEAVREMKKLIKI